MNKTKLKSNLMLLMTAMIWGFAFVAQRVGADHVGAMTFNGVRFALGALSLLPAVLIFGRKLPMDRDCKKQTFLASLAGGAALFVASLLQQWGVALTQSAGKAGFITSLYTVLVPVIGFLLLRRRTGIYTWIGAFLAVGGLYLLSMTGDERAGIGDLVLILGAIVWAAHILIIDYFNGKQINAIVFAMGQFAVCAVCNLMGAGLFEEITVSGIAAAGVPILYGGLMSVGVAYTLQIFGQRGADPTAASVILSTESMFSALGGIIILGESMPISGYIGCVLIFAGVIYAQLTPGSEPAQKEKAS
ncbi:MAG: DMT family transporter [Ruminococcaceae bacterium]|nr:DMT family transporter [Oscillospiraceae bacterium]